MRQSDLSKVTSLLMAGPGIESRSPSPRPVIFLYIMALTLVGVHLSGPGPQGPAARAGVLAQLKEARVPLS